MIQPIKIWNSEQTHNFILTLPQNKQKEISSLEKFSGRTTSKLVILSNYQFSKLIVLFRGPNGSSSTPRWWCICLCESHNIRLVSGQDLKSGHTTSCGCYNKAQISVARRTNYTNQVINQYTCLFPTDQRDKKGDILWMIKCNKHNWTGYYAPTNLFKGNPCPFCNVKSKGEQKIAKILQNNNIPFVREVTFQDCRSPKNRKYPYDFYVNDSWLIEYDGNIHFTSGGVRGWNTRESFQKRKMADSIKTTYALDHNIPLIRIPYWQYDRLKLKDLIPESSDFLIKK